MVNAIDEREIFGGMCMRERSVNIEPSDPLDERL